MHASFTTFSAATVATVAPSVVALRTDLNLPQAAAREGNSKGNESETDTTENPKKNGRQNINMTRRVAGATAVQLCQQLFTECDCAAKRAAKRAVET